MAYNIKAIDELVELLGVSEFDSFSPISWEEYLNAKKNEK